MYREFDGIAPLSKQPSWLQVWVAQLTLWIWPTVWALRVMKTYRNPNVSTSL